jgi:hypothetical protein
MSAFSEVGANKIDNAILDLLKQYAPKLIWDYYHKHENETIWHESGKIKLGFFSVPWSVTITWKKARPVIERIAGPEQPLLPEIP